MNGTDAIGDVAPELPGPPDDAVPIGAIVLANGTAAAVTFGAANWAASGAAGATLKYKVFSLSTLPGRPLQTGSLV